MATDVITTPTPEPMAPTDREERRLPFPLLIPAVLSGILLALCYFPVAWGSVLGWVALVPILCLVRSEARPRRVLLASYAGGLVFFVAALQWFRVADTRMIAAWLALAAYCALYIPAGVALLRFLDSRTGLPLIVTLPAVWTALELLRSVLLGGFAWYYLAHTQHQVIPLIQISDLGGAYAVSFLVAMGNAILFEWLYASKRLRGWLSLPTVPKRTTRSLLLHTAVVAVAVVGTLGYGFARLAQTDFTAGPRVALLQGNLDQRIRNAAWLADGQNAAMNLARHFQELSDAAARQQPKPDIIIWPETSYPFGWIDLDESVRPEDLPKPLLELVALDRRRAKIVAEMWGPNVVFGLNAETVFPDKDVRAYNSALLISEGGKVAGRYDKIHRVPFGEFVPFVEWFPWMSAFSPYESAYGIDSGKSQPVLPLDVGDRHFGFGVIICFEDTDPTLARQYVTDADPERRADFLVNMSNDGWFDGSSEHEEHLAIARFRAVECRRSLVRAVNMGISAVIDGNGRVTDLPAKNWGASKKIAAVLTAEVPIDRRSSLYAVWGDWLPIGSAVFVGLATLWGVARPRGRAVRDNLPPTVS